ncbi:MAG: hypothetical protein Q7R96_03505 [Nanoarchaeota archaeon]|nr:hypothetical protein [Nanoarchaeota archaeon]
MNFSLSSLQHVSFDCGQLHSDTELFEKNLRGKKSEHHGVVAYVTADGHTHMIPVGSFSIREFAPLGLTVWDTEELQAVNPALHGTQAVMSLLNAAGYATDHQVQVPHTNDLGVYISRVVANARLRERFVRMMQAKRGYKNKLIREVGDYLGSDLMPMGGEYFDNKELLFKQRGGYNIRDGLMVIVDDHYVPYMGPAPDGIEETLQNCKFVRDETIEVPTESRVDLKSRVYQTHKQVIEGEKSSVHKA